MTDMSGAADLIRNVAQNVMQTTQDYNAKVLEFVAANSKASMEYLSTLASSKTASDAFELTTRYEREQSKALTILASSFGSTAKANISFRSSTQRRSRKPSERRTWSIARQHARRRGTLLMS
jgi:Phasin protein